MEYNSQQYIGINIQNIKNIQKFEIYIINYKFMIYEEIIV